MLRPSLFLASPALAAPLAALSRTGAILTATAAVSLALAGCATAPRPGPVADAPSAAVAEPEESATVSNYGLFLAGEAALQSGHSEDAARYFSRAAQGAEDQEPATRTLIRDKAFTAAVMAGDIDAAAALAPPPDPTSATMTQRLAKLVRAVDALAQNDGRKADAILSAAGAGSSFSGGVALLRPWVAAAAGDQQRALALPDGPAAALTRVSAQYGQALLLERAKRYDQAEADYKTLAAGQFAALYVISYAEYLQRRDRSKDAEAVLKEAILRAPHSREFKRALARVEARKAPPPVPSLKQGAAQALTSAAEMALIDKRFTDGEIYLRLALRLDPDEQEAWVFLGDILVQAGDSGGARTAYAHVPQTSADWIDAQQRIIASYQTDGDDETALRLAQTLAKAAPGDRETLILEADLLRAVSRFSDSVTVLDQVIASDKAEADWALYFERGTSLDRAGHWPEAEKDLTKALALHPDQPDVLNYLGYSWVTRGEKLDQAMVMLQKAYLAQPDSGEIADSLGWAYYNLGDFKQAVQRLERAVSLEPVNAEINDHLGDAYWRSGRQTEARYQWSRVLTLSPSADLRSAVERKLTSGLGSQAAPARS